MGCNQSKAVELTIDPSNTAGDAQTSNAHSAAATSTAAVTDDGRFDYERPDGQHSSADGEVQVHPQPSFSDSFNYDDEPPSFVLSGKTGHAEAIYIVFDEREISYSQLLAVFWSIHDPTTLNRQRNDRGTQYRSGIYVHNDEQRKVALASRDERQKLLTRAIVTEIEQAATFWDAEDYHQRYLEKGGQCADKGCEVKIRCYG